MPNETHAPLIDRLMALKPDDLSPNAWTLKAGVSRTVFNDIRRRDNVRHDTLLKLLRAINVTLADFETGKDRAMLDQLPAEGMVLSEVRGTGFTAEEVWAARGLADAPRIPLVGSAIGGHIEGIDEHVELTELHMTEALDYLRRPAHLQNDPEAYAVTTVGDSMYPRFKPGERVLVSPRASAAIGDDVIVQLRNDKQHDDTDPEHADRVTMVLIKELVRITSSEVVLRQFNPDMTFTVPRKRVAAIHRVSTRL